MKTLEELKTKINCNYKLRSIEAATESGASNWLTVLPLKKQGFSLEKQAFWDGIRIRYNIPLERLPTNCCCGLPFDLQHAFSCPKGGFTIISHNEIRDLTAEVLDEICSNVNIEPNLTPLTGEKFKLSTITTDEARADVSARGFWVKGQTAYCDVRVFNPLAKCYLNQSLVSAHKRNENEKKRQYNQRILQVENGTFTPLVFTCFGGMSRECSRFFSQAAELMAEKRKQPKSIISGWLKTRLNFSLLRSCTLCVRGSRSYQINREGLSNIDISQVIHESKLEVNNN